MRVRGLGFRALLQRCAGAQRGGAPPRVPWTSYLHAACRPQPGGGECRGAPTPVATPFLTSPLRERFLLPKPLIWCRSAVLAPPCFWILFLQPAMLRGGAGRGCHSHALAPPRQSSAGSHSPAYARSLCAIQERMGCSFPRASLFARGSHGGPEALSVLCLPPSV